jgi:hypothetical protein
VGKLGPRQKCVQSDFFRYILRKVMLVSCQGNLLLNESVLSKWRHAQVPVPSSGDITELS